MHHRTIRDANVLLIVLIADRWHAHWIQGFSHARNIRSLVRNLSPLVLGPINIWGKFRIIACENLLCRFDMNDTIESLIQAVWSQLRIERWFTFCLVSMSFEQRQHRNVGWWHVSHSWQLTKQVVRQPRRTVRSDYKYPILIRSFFFTSYKQ